MVGGRGRHGGGCRDAGLTTAEPLEVVAVDVSDFPRVVIDVALPEWELPGDVTADAFEMPGATGVVAEALLASDLTVALVLDDGPGVSVESIATQQGAVTELVRNIPPDVELLTATTSGALVGPTTDRAATLGRGRHARHDTGPRRGDGRDGGDPRPVQCSRPLPTHVANSS